MGLFLSMSGIVGSEEKRVVEALRAFVEANGGSLTEATLTTDDEGCLVIYRGRAGTTAMYPEAFLDWDGAARYLSQRLETPVFSFHIHDGDLWMYLLFDNGQLVDRFNPMPDYWEELDDAERALWEGNAAEVARRVPGVSPEQVAPYLIPWSEEILDAEEPRKALPSDEFHYGEDWQLVDFMNTLGFEYPVDDRGEVRGGTYRFTCVGRGTG